MKRPSRREIRADILALKAKNEKPLITHVENQPKLTPKMSSQRIRKQGSN